jgi:serine/threonine protein kinase
MPVQPGTTLDHGKYRVLRLLGRGGFGEVYLAEELLLKRLVANNEPRIDIYALGAVLYQMLAGRPYLDFRPGDTPNALAENILLIRDRGPVTPSTYNNGVAPWLDSLVMSALAKVVEARPVSASTYRAALLAGAQAAPGSGPGGDTVALPIQTPATSRSVTAYSVLWRVQRMSAARRGRSDLPGPTVGSRTACRPRRRIQSMSPASSDSGACAPTDTRPPPPPNLRVL